MAINVLDILFPVVVSLGFSETGLCPWYDSTAATGSGGTFVTGIGKEGAVPIASGKGVGIGSGVMGSSGMTDRGNVFVSGWVIAGVPPNKACVLAIICCRVRLAWAWVSKKV